MGTSNGKQSKTNEQPIQDTALTQTTHSDHDHDDGQSSKHVVTMSIPSVNNTHTYQYISYDTQLNVITIAYLRHLCPSQYAQMEFLLSLSQICTEYLEFLWMDMWDNKLCGTGIVLDNNLTEASYDSDRTKMRNKNKKYGDAEYIWGWQSVFGKNEVNIDTNAKYCWSFEVTHAEGSGNGQEIHIGVIGKKHDEWTSDEFKDILKQGNKVHYSQEKYHCMYCGRCALFSTPNPGSYGKYLAKCVKIAHAVYDGSPENTRVKSPLQFANIGNTLDIFMDCEQGTVQFAVNHVVYDPVWNGLKDNMDLTYRVFCSMVEGRTVTMKHFAADYDVVT